MHKGKPNRHAEMSKEDVQLLDMLGRLGFNKQFFIVNLKTSNFFASFKSIIYNFSKTTKRTEYMSR